MKINHLIVENFKGITHIDLQDLKETVVIAGTNGCGKSSIFDALRLWKTAYGGYFANEMSSWYAEHGLSMGKDSPKALLQDKTKPMIIYAELELADSERNWLRNNAELILKRAGYRRRVPEQAFEWRNFDDAHLSDNLRVHTVAVEKEVAADLPKFLSELNLQGIPGRLFCNPEGVVELEPSLILSRIFSFYDPEHLGVFDHHGPQRTFGRESIGGINLQIEQFENQRQQYALSNTSGKYGNVKTELASAFVRDLIVREYSAQQGIAPTPAGLVETVKEMFDKFFPGKRFLGVKAEKDGKLSFDVETAAGRHDLSDLSSGEKELIYGYLRLKNQSPRNSVILLDEPELHLNPRLTEGLPEFYHRHIGVALNNQLWLITHSDSILRQSVGREGFSVFHMQSAGLYEGDEQAVPLMASNELDRAMFDLVGDLAAYAPNAKTIFMEGGGSSKFDEWVVQELFPSFSKKMNLISSGNKSKVRLVHDLLEKAKANGVTTSNFYSITDRDDEANAMPLPGHSYMWDRYHIENYLLEEKFIRLVMIDLKIPGAASTLDSEILDRLRSCAEATLSKLVQHEVEHEVGNMLRKAIKVSTSRDKPFDPSELRTAVERSAERLTRS